jgi:hypothetical protein
MYASLPLSCPERVVERRDAAKRRQSTTRETPSTPTRIFCGETSRWTISRRYAVVSSFILMRGVEGPGEDIEQHADE